MNPGLLLIVIYGSEGKGFTVFLKKVPRLMNKQSPSKVSHYLGTASGWRKKRLRIAMALRNQGWSHQLIAEYLEVSPKSLMRDIKCFVIDPQGLNASP